MPDATPNAKVKPDYVKVTDGVMDKVTGLIWQVGLPSSYSMCMHGDASQPDYGLCSWSDAKAYCAALALSSGTSWRLPGKIELESIVDPTRSDTVLALDAAFGGQRSINDDFWTTSSYTAGPRGNAWYVNFAEGWTYYKPVEILKRVRCVH
jgi:hypothetical protein